MKRYLSIIIAFLLIFAAAATVGGCTPSGSTPDEVQTSGTQAVTALTQTAGSTAIPTTAVQTQATTQSKSNGSGGSGNSGGSSGGGSGGSHSSGNLGGGSNMPVPTSCTLTVGSHGYTAKIGDTVTYYFYLKTPALIENIQAATSYDSSMLKLKSAPGKKMFPVAYAGMVYNTKLENSIRFNASDIDGYDFTKNGVLACFEFEVTANGGTAISTTIEMMDQLGGAAYIDNFKIYGDIDCEEKLVL